MTIQKQESSVTHDGNGLTTEWPFEFIIPDAGSARVGVFDIALSALTLLEDTDYTISGLGSEDGGEVVYPLTGPPLSAAYRLVIWRDLGLTQDMDVTNQAPFYPEVLERQLDRIVMMVQQVQEESNRSIKTTLGSNLTPDEFVAGLEEGAAIAQAAAAAAQLSAMGAAASAGNASTSEGNAASSEAAAEAAADFIGGFETALEYIQDNTALITSIPTLASETEDNAIAAAASAASIDPALLVHVTPDSFTSGQKLQALTNIGALSNEQDQSAQSFSASRKINILKNTLQAWETIVEGSLSSAVASIDLINLADYRSLRLRGSLLAASSGGILAVRVSGNNGATFDSGAGDYPRTGPYWVGATSGVNTAAAAFIALSAGSVHNVAGFEVPFVLELEDFNRNKFTQFYSRSGYSPPSGAFTSGMEFGYRANGVAHNAIRILNTAGNIAAGGQYLLEGRR